eukprot:SAG22_NODE_764_length_7397_cov_6.955604_3_plen_101_part_00
MAVSGGTEGGGNRICCPHCSYTAIPSGRVGAGPGRGRGHQDQRTAFSKTGRKVSWYSRRPMWTGAALRPPSGAEYAAKCLSSGATVVSAASVAGVARPAP